MLVTYLKTKDAAEVLNVSEDTVIKMVNDGTISPRFWYRTGRQGRELRIHPAALDPLMHPEDAGPHPQTHSLLTLMDRVIRTVEGDLDDMRRVRSLIAEAAR